MFRTKKRRSPTAYVIAEATPTCAKGEALRVTAKSAGSQRSDRARTRILMCAALFVFMFGSLGVRLVYVSFGDWAPRSQIASALTEETRRPELVDRNGAILAGDLPLVTLEVAGREVWDAAETASKLSAILPSIDAEMLEQKLIAKRYVEVARNLTPAKQREIFALGLPGVRFETRDKRFYPQADLAAHVIGHGEPGRRGVMGLEKALNDFPADTPVRASIDIRVQQALEEELGVAFEEFSAIAAWGGVIDVYTGEVIALASLPDFDPNDPGAYEADARRNRATYDRYELGSAFKAFTVASALDAGITEEHRIYDARGTFKVADRTISDYRGKNRLMTLSEVVQHSSNIGIAQITEELGVRQQKDYLRKLGLFESLDIELAENRDPQLPYKWGPVEAATIGYGHGISVTPLHLLAAFAAVVNGGDYISPTFLARESAPQKTQIFSTETSNVMRRILRRVITDGTASKAEVEGYFPIGKTATADKPSANGGYNRNTRIASFVGAVPGYAPRYAILVSLDEPKPTKDTHGYATAGWNAAPTFSRFVKRLTPILNMMPVNEAEALSAFAEPTEAYREARLGEAEKDVR